MTVEQTGPAQSGMWTNHGDDIYVNSDKSAVVESGSEDAAYLLVASGSQIPIEEARKYGLIGSNLPDRPGRDRGKDEEQGRDRGKPDRPGQPEQLPAQQQGQDEEQGLREAEDAERKRGKAKEQDASGLKIKRDDPENKGRG